MSQHHSLRIFQLSPAPAAREESEWSERCLAGEVEATVRKIELAAKKLTPR